ncbi:MAG TPA: hypothetical protein VFI22_01270 [Thermomicrobiales bacterium]|nr:hypothetical protein [Thermomicrobiales bacterium]
MSEQDAAAGADTINAATRRLPEMVMKEEPSNASVAGRDMVRADAGEVRAANVTMEKSGAEAIVAERLSMENSGAKSIEAKSAQIEQSGIMTLRSDNASVYQSSALAVFGKTIRLAKSAALIVKADRVEADAGTRVLLHIGSAADGTRPALDAAGAAAFGAAFGAVVLLFGSLLRRLFR